MKRDKNGRFAKGARKPPNSGRRRGTPNKATRAWKDFVTSLVSDPEQQQALVEAIQSHPELLFKAAEHAHGRPCQTVDQEFTGPIEVRWKDKEDD